MVLTQHPNTFSVSNSNGKWKGTGRIMEPLTFSPVGPEGPGGPGGPDGPCKEKYIEPVINMPG